MLKRLDLVIDLAHWLIKARPSSISAIMSWVGIVDIILEQSFDMKSKDFIYFLIQVIFWWYFSAKYAKTVKRNTIG